MRRNDQIIDTANGIKNVFKLLLLCLTFCVSNSLLSYSNNLIIEKLQLIDSQTLQFEISWENSWNFDDSISPGNHDAVWVFGKIKMPYVNGQHLDLHHDSGQHQVMGSSILEIVPVSDGKGVFIKRAEIGSGEISPTTIQVALSNPLPEGVTSLDIFGIEMVFIPEGSFYVGDSVSNSSLGNGADGLPFFINSENEIPVGNQNGELFCADEDSRPDANVPVEFPKGFQGFYCMKYEISQEQFADFLSTLSFDQQETILPISPDTEAGTNIFSSSNFATFRNGISISQTGIRNETSAVLAVNGNENSLMNEAGDGLTRACNFLTWTDLTSYLDWACLRPMTGLEFEKICRGNLPAIGREFAWGTSIITDADSVINDGTVYEQVSDFVQTGSGLGNHGNFSPNDLGPLRCGFGGNANSNRLTIGAAFYGVLEMSGNVWEQCINLSETGLQFEGENGDGELDSFGFSDIHSWCPQSGDCAGHRGGAWNSGIFENFRDLAISDRYFSLLNPNLQRRNTVGGRGVRSIE